MTPMARRASWISVRRVTLLFRRSLVRWPLLGAGQTEGLRFGVWYVEHETKHRGRKDLALRVGLERKRAAAVERAVQEKVESFEIRKLESLDWCGNDVAKMFADAIECE